DGQVCNAGSDCVNGVCENNICVSCTDGRRNQGETGIDCGGPCAPCPAPPELPQPVCTDKISSWHVLIGLIVLILAGYFGGKYYSLSLKKKSKVIPGWLTYVKEEPVANVIGMIILVLIALLSLIYDNACFENCLAFKSKYLLTAISLILTAALGIRLYGQLKDLVPKKLPLEKTWMKILLIGIIATLFVVAILLNAYFTKACGTCFDNRQNQGETGIDCGGPCRPCPQVPFEVSPFAWFTPLAILLIIVGLVMGFFIAREIKQTWFGPKIPRAPKIKEIAKPEIPKPEVKEYKPPIPEPRFEIPKEKIIPKPVIPPKIKKPAKPAVKLAKVKPEYLPKFRDIPNLTPEIKIMYDEIKKLFIMAYQALANEDFNEVQRISSIITKKYRYLPRILRDDVYYEIMILYNKIEKALI
ncbi:hypothetical protein KY312_03255, partial [Candidatus Woesearchaeota archaeon]|nr:hypothetical protein [Candidatus Woesearchaeota archaeon]